MKFNSLISGLGAVAAGGILLGSVTLGGMSAVAQQAPPVPEAQGSVDVSARSLVSQRMRTNLGARRYEDTASRRAFILDRRGDEVLLKFEDSPEVYVLRATTAQRGDAFLRSADGKLVLRVTEMGNVISYVGNKDGAPAAMAAVASPLDAPAMTDSLTEAVQDTANRLSELADRDVTVFGSGAFVQDERWVVDALTVAAIGVERSGNYAHKLKTVRLVRSETPDVEFRDGELVIGVDPREGYAGRPSSDAVTAAMKSKQSAD